MDGLHTLADERDEAIGQRVRSNPDWATASSQQKAVMLQDALLPVPIGDGIEYSVKL